MGSELITALAALLGVLLGSFGTFFVQSNLIKRQREWALNDQWRQWQREQLNNISDQLNRLVSSILEIQLNPAYKEGQMDITSIAKELSCSLTNLSSFRAGDFGDLLRNKIKELGGNEKLDKADWASKEFLDFMTDLNAELQQEIRTLVKKTYEP